MLSHLLCPLGRATAHAPLLPPASNAIAGVRSIFSTLVYRWQQRYAEHRHESSLCVRARIKGQCVKWPTQIAEFRRAFLTIGCRSSANMSVAVVIIGSGCRL